MCWVMSLFTATLVLSLIGCDGGLVPDVGGDGDGSPGRDNVVLVWGEACLESIRATKHGPPMTARTLAIVHTAIYDAWAAYDEVALGTRLGGSLRRPEAERTRENKEEAISYAAYRALVDLFPSRTEVFEATMRALGYDPANATTDVTTPAGVGNTAAAALLAFRHDDGANQLGGYADYTGYEPVNPPLLLAGSQAFDRDFSQIGMLW